MPCIKVRKEADGSTRYTAIVRLRSGKTIVLRFPAQWASYSAAICRFQSKKHNRASSG
jgi:hypothetical protein